MRFFNIRFSVVAIELQSFIFLLHFIDSLFFDFQAAINH